MSETSAPFLFSCIPQRPSATSWNDYARVFAGSRPVARAEELLLSSVVVGELLYGFRYGSRFRDNRDLLESFLREPEVRWLPVTLRTADRYGAICAQLRGDGAPIPANDIWIAAHAMETGADLCSFDKHFERVAGLSWIEPRLGG